jgi:hypothetical protein
MRKSAQELKEWIDDKLDWQSQPGHMFWKKSGPGVKAGAEAGCGTHHLGYWLIGVHYKMYKRSRMVFLMFNNYLPKYIDHKDGDSANDHPDNLRACTSAQNSWNRKDTRGIDWRSEYQKWQVRIMAHGKRLFLGHFDTEEEAKEAREKAEKSMHREFRRLEW